MRLRPLVGVADRDGKRQRTAALQDAVAQSKVPVTPPGFGVRLSPAAFALSKSGDRHFQSRPVGWVEWVDCVHRVEVVSPRPNPLPWGEEGASPAVQAVETWGAPEAAAGPSTWL